MSPSLLLETLPVELQASIIRFLDPVGLISLSQTNSHFRRLIDPTRTHFAERLLELECLYTVGGPLIRFSRTGQLEPNRNTPEWEANRWACTSCLRLLPHYAFNNKLLSRLPYRKPITGSAAATHCTSWEPVSNMKKRSSMLQSLRKRHHSHEERQLRRRYSITTTHCLDTTSDSIAHEPNQEIDLMNRLTEFQNSGMAGFENTTFDEFVDLLEEVEHEVLDQEALRIELDRAGYNRHHRRCNECRYRRGEFRGCAGPGKGIGTVKVPIVVGRQESFGTVVDRYFPGISDVLETQRPPFSAPVFVIYREDAVDRLWTLYRVRCPGCSWWQEMRAFRVGGMYPRWQPLAIVSESVNDLYSNWDNIQVTERFLNRLWCNHCFVKEHGRQALGQKLVQWLNILIDAELLELTANLRTGFKHLSWRLQHAPKGNKTSTKALICDMRSMLQKEHTKVTHADVALLRQRRTQWLALYPQLKEYGDCRELWFRPDRWFWDWVDTYDESEALWFWLRGLKEEIQEERKADILVDWALCRDEIAHS